MGNVLFITLRNIDFLYSGVGIRQVCDIAIFTAQYEAEIDWECIVRDCASIRIDRFAAALFRVADRHLGFTVPEAFSGYDVDEGPLLEDMLAGGMYGTADEDRLHSASITLDAVAAQRQRRGAKGIPETAAGSEGNPCFPVSPRFFAGREISLSSEKALATAGSLAAADRRLFDKPQNQRICFCSDRPAAHRTFEKLRYH